MTRRLIGALTVALLCAVAPPAHAAGDAQSSGGCYSDSLTQEDVTGPDRWTGAMYAVVTVVSPTGAAASAEVTCELHVNGEVRTATTGSGTGVVAFAAPFEFTASENDVFYLCTKIDYTSDDTPTEHFCWSRVWLPPNNINETIYNAFEALNIVITEHVEPVVCGSLASQAPGNGPVLIEEDGDLYVDGSWVLDCPPYEV